MLDKTYVNPRHEEAGYYALADLPQRDSVDNITMSTGWWELDQIFKLYPGQFVVVTGIPGHGKTTFVQDLVCRACRAHGLKAAWASFEQTPTRDHKRAFREWLLRGRHGQRHLVLDIRRVGHCAECLFAPFG